MRFNKERPIFLQIADHLTWQVIGGELPPGSRLASARDLAAALEVNPNTAVRALQHLADEGIARAERGTGYFVDEAGRDRAAAALRQTFFEEDLPRFFQTMEKLGIPFEELEKRYREGRS